MTWPIGGRRLSEPQRAEILRLYLAGKIADANNIAAAYGLSPWYAYKLANQSGLLPLTRWSGKGPKNDPVIERSPHQKKARLLKLRGELLEMGYSVVRTEWLQAQLDKAPSMEAAE